MSYSPGFHKFFDEIHEFMQSAPIVWFRGHSHSHYELQSSLFRDVSIDTDPDRLKDLLFIERQTYNNFLSVGFLHHTTKSWELLYLMQHHQVPTRLLDWSESLSVALYFAIEKWRMGLDCTPELWLLNPISLNARSGGVSSVVSLNENSTFTQVQEGSHPNLNFNNSFAIMPLINNSRISSQKGVFTVQGNAGVPLDQEDFPNEQFGTKKLTSNELKRITIDISLREELLEFLRINGVKRSSLFPDLDGLAFDLRVTYKLRIDKFGIKKEKRTAVTTAE